VITFQTGPNCPTPLRSNLKKHEGKTVKVTAVFARRGRREVRPFKIRGGKKSPRTVSRRTYPTVLIENVVDANSGELLADHLWLNAGKSWDRSALKPGCTVRFQARVIPYRAGYWGKCKLKRDENRPRINYALTSPKGLEVIQSETRPGPAADRRVFRSKRCGSIRIRRVTQAHYPESVTAYQRLPVMVNAAQ
jgi:hypothetical protein